MPRGKELNEIEKQRIMDLFECGLTQRAIADKIGRSQGAIKNFLRLGKENYGKNKRPGRPPKYSPATKRKVLREVSSTGASSSQMVSRFNLKCHPCTVRRWIAASKKFSYCKIQRGPQLKESHIEERKKFAEKYIQKGEIWSHIIFSDEKKFNLDGPDGYNYYWRDLRKEPKILSRRAAGGGGIMVWAAFKKDFKSEIAFISSRINAEKYQEVLEEHLIPLIIDAEDENILFQQDNAPVHNALSTKNWFQEFGIEVLPWPALSPDLNPIENLWGILAREVYNKEKQEIQSVCELKERIEDAWNNIPLETINNLVASLPNRLLEVIKKNGKITKY